MQDKISQILIKNPLYRKITLKNLVTQKAIYKNGEFCDVKLVRIQQSEGSTILNEQMKNKKYALKIISKERIRNVTESYEREYQYIFNQIYALYLISHPNIVEIYWHHEDQQNIYILTEYAGTNLYKYMRNKTLEQETIKNIFKQICQGVNAIHSQKIVHRDICLQNIVINSQTLQIKIIDFGISIEFTGGRTTALGMLTIMAPQVYKQNKYNSKADIWSLGVVLYELFHKRNPFVNQDEQYTEQQFSQKRDKLLYQIDEAKVSQQAKRLITKILSINPQHRPNIQQIISSKWITGNQEVISQKLINGNYLAEQDQKTKQMANRKSLFAFSEDEPSNQNIKKGKTSRNFQQQSNQQDDFFFDKIINKMSLNNSVAELQQRLRKLIKMRSNQMTKKRDLTLKLLTLQKQKIQKDISTIKN